MGNYDDWKTDADAAPDPGHGGGTSTYRVRCTDCAWAFTGRGLTPTAAAVAQGDAHHADTGHAIANHHMVVQSRWTRRTV